MLALASNIMLINNYHLLTTIKRLNYMELLIIIGIAVVFFGVATYFLPNLKARRSEIYNNSLKRN